MTEEADKPRVYIETTIASAYHETRTDAQTVARRHWTREWWDNCAANYEFVTSVAAIDELKAGNYPHQQDAINKILTVEVLPYDEEVDKIAATYISHQLMPADPYGDAMHLAVASLCGCDFLVTWNCRHLANANKFERIRKINLELGLTVPILTTPLGILGVAPDS